MKGLTRGRSAVLAVFFVIFLVYIVINFGTPSYKHLSSRAAQLLYRRRTDLLVGLTQKPKSSNPDNRQLNLTSKVNLIILNLSEPITKPFKRAELKTSRGKTPIFVYDVGMDKWVSGAILHSGAWESSMVTTWQTLLGMVPDATAVDIGANLGQYGLAALVMKRRSVFVEPVLRNAQRIVKSIQAGPLDFKRFAMVVQNALSNTRRRILFRTFEGNIGGTQILDQKFETQADKRFGSAFTILLDDLTNVVPGTDLIMKVDAECSEKQALGRSDRFFARYRVHAIMMEWHKCSSDTPETSQFIADMARRGFLPYHLSAPPFRALDPKKARSGWPGDILWVNESLNVLVKKKH